jgi:cellulose biosynthesis protein BcsQ
LTANLGGQAAAAGYSVLLVDLNRQANLADDLGYRGTTADDDGAGLLTAMMSGTPFAPAAGIRPNLDVIPGGTKLNMLTAFALTEMQHRGQAVYTSFAASLAPIASGYDLILIDTPPENVILGDFALGAAKWALMPTKSDSGGLVGMRLTAGRFEAAQQINPTISLLGVVLFGTGSGATAIQKELGEEVAAAFGGDSPLFESTIRHSERVARDCRKSGRLAHELELDAETRSARSESLRKESLRKKSPRKSETKGETKRRITASVSDDYYQLTLEVLQILANAEAAQGGVPA